MKRFVTVVLAGLLLAGQAIAAGERGTKDEAKALVDRAVLQLGKDGAAAYPVFSEAKGAFVDRDLYLVVFDKKGNILAHGANKALVGVNLWDAEDPDGVKFVREFWKTAEAAADGAGWVNFKFTHPQTKKIEKKIMFVRKTGDVVIVAGAYPEG